LGDGGRRISNLRPAWATQQDSDSKKQMRFQQAVENQGFFRVKNYSSLALTFWREKVHEKNENSPYTYLLFNN
jgi:hypothetical protein